MLSLDPQDKSIRRWLAGRVSHYSEVSGDLYRSSRYQNPSVYNYHPQAKLSSHEREGCMKKLWNALLGVYDKEREAEFWAEINKDVPVWRWVNVEDISRV